MNNSIYKIRKTRLEGAVTVSGAKNSALKLLTASLLTSGRICLPNFPIALSDIEIHLDMLKVLGKRLLIEENTVSISEDYVSTDLVWEERSIRNTLLILGCLLARQGKGRVPLPGGCKLGERKHDLHIMIFEKLGAKVWEDDDFLYAESKGRLIGTDIYLPIRSTGATENGILCGALAQGTTTIWNPHIRPEVLDLVELLRKMGAIIDLYGQQKIVVRGVESLGGCEHQVIPDNMEALTWLIASVITNGDIEIKNFPTRHLEVPLIHLRESGAKFYLHENDVIVRGGKCFPVDISTGPYPGINSDMQPLFAVFGAMASGESKIVDLRFPGRYKYTEELAKMGLDCRVQDGMLIINGGNQLKGQRVRATDLRAGIALLLAGLTAEDETIIEEGWQIDRGYENLTEKFRALSGNELVIEKASRLMD